MPELRQQRRVVFSARARIRGEGNEPSIVARVHNLSERGIFVTAPGVLQAGERVRCRLFLGDERRVLRGKVAWVSPRAASAPLPTGVPGVQPMPSSEVGAGIEFEDLSTGDSELLRKLVAPNPEDERPIEVWFAGMTAPVKARAVVSRDGLRLQTRLPFLRLGSPVRIAFEQRGVRETREGVLDAVVMAPSAADGVPRLYVSVATPDGEVVQGGTIEARSVDDAKAEPVGFVPSTLVDEVALAAPSGPVPPPPPYVSRQPTPTIVQPPVATFRPLPEHSEKTMRVPAPTPPGSGLVGTGRRRLPLVAGAGLAAAVMLAVGWPDRSAPPPVPPLAATGTPSPPPSSVPSEPVAAEAEAPAAEPGASPAIQIEPMAEEEARPEVKGDTKASARGEAASSWPFQLAVKDGISEIFVPLVGGARSKVKPYQLKDLSAVAVNVPRARAVGQPGRYLVQVPGVTQVWVEEKPGSVHVRFHLARGARQSEVNVEDGGVRLLAR